MPFDSFVKFSPKGEDVAAALMVDFASLRSLSSLKSRSDALDGKTESFPHVERQAYLENPGHKGDRVGVPSICPLLTQTLLCSGSRKISTRSTPL